MSNLDLEYLLGGYATNTLTEEERHALLKASLVNQRLFDLLADEQVLKELLDDPAVRRRLLQQLKEPEEAGGLTAALAWLTRTETLAVAGSLAAVTLATVFGLRFWEQSRELLKEDNNRPGLLEAIKEPTVRSKLPSKPASPPQTQPPAPPTSAPPPPTASLPRTAKQEGRLRPDHALQDAPPVSRHESGPPPPVRKSDDPPRSSIGEEADVPAAQPFATPQSSPPVVIPKVPTKARPVPGQASPPTADRPAKAEAAPPSERAEAPASPRPQKDAPVAPTPSDEPPSTPTAQAPGLPLPLALSKRLAGKPLPVPSLPQGPAISARTLFMGEELKEAARSVRETSSDPDTTTTGSASDVQPHEEPGEASDAAQPEKLDSEISPTITAQATREQARRSSPLGIRVHHRRLPLQGTLGDQSPGGLALPQLFVEVNQPGYLYVLTQDASGAWTVGAPAASPRASSVPAASAVQKATTYQILLVDESASSASHKTYVLFSRTPLNPLERALEPTGGGPTTAETLEETNELLAGLLRAFAAHPLVTEEVAEAAAGKKAGPMTYVADAVQPSRTEILYRIPPLP